MRNALDMIVCMKLQYGDFVLVGAMTLCSVLDMFQTWCSVFVFCVLTLYVPVTSGMSQFCVGGVCQWEVMLADLLVDVNGRAFLLVKVVDVSQLPITGCGPGKFH